ncbi:MAG: zinc ribbon domain-containing protein [Candidatus Korobacteraceae bacterium]
MESDFRTPEFQETLRSVIEALLRATADDRLPALTAEEIHHWLSNLTLKDVADARASALDGALARRSAAGESSPSAESHSARCPGCGTPLLPSASFCAECGRTVAGARRCLNCNGDISQQANFCPSCGSKAA